MAGTLGAKAEHLNIEFDKLKLPTVSAHGLKVLEIINSDDINFKDLRNAISADPMLSAILLKYANSPLYRSRVEVCNIRNAISILGINNVRSAIMIYTMRAYCESGNALKEYLWELTVKLATAAKLISRKTFKRLSDDIELTAMMSQTGALVLCSNFMDDYEKVMTKASLENLTLEDAEKDILGVDRTEITTFMGNRFRLPSVTIDALNKYFKNQELESIESKTDKHVAVLKAARLFVETDDDPDADAEVVQYHGEYMFKLLNLDINDIEEILQNYQQKITEKFSF